jgi:hypothetical protein
LKDLDDTQTKVLVDGNDLAARNRPVIHQQIHGMIRGAI